MSNLSTPRVPGALHRLGLLALSLLAAIAIATVSGCGGGVGVGGTGTYAAGPISGFGSIVVADIRFDDNSAAVVDDDGAAVSRDALRLGMTVEVDAGPLGADGVSAVASRVRLATALVGPVQAIDLAAGRLRVLGQIVTLRSDTVFDPRLPNGLASLSVGDGVAVHGSADRALAVVAATRIEPRSLAAGWRARGTVDAVDLAARTLRIGLQVYSFPSATPPAGLQVGSAVELRLSPALDGSGRAVIAAFATAERELPERDEVRLRGRITAFTSAAAFEVDGRAVDAASARFPQGSAGLALGARVEVRGRSESRLVRAAEVRVESDDEVRDRGVELHGAVEAVDPAGGTFRLRGLTIRTTRSDLRLDGGTLADLVVGRQVEVKAQLAADRVSLEATRIKFE